jgi:ribonuclease HII
VSSKNSDPLPNAILINQNDEMTPRPDPAVLAAERLEHLRAILEFDRMVLSEHKKASVIVGTDEVGRGCLAGPVVACAVILPVIERDSQLEQDLARLNDSKLVPPDVRGELAERLRQICQFAIGEASVEEIDEINILQASLLAMRRAVRRLKVDAPHVVLIDGNKKIPSLKSTQVTVIAGDSKSASIAAASIIAKVHRDAFMLKLHKKFPQYVWNSNKGYRSPAHYEALNEFGMTKWHRQSFNCGQHNEEDDDE